jgi:hypothetical protein
MPTSKPEKKEPKKPLSVTHPQLAKEADGWDTSKITFGSAKKFLWKCAKGHRWESSPAKRAIRGDGCPICSGYRLVKGFNDLATTHPKIAEEAYGWDSTLIRKGHKEKLSWLCPNGHYYFASPDSRTNMNSGCSVCSGKKVLFGYNDLETKYPKIAEEAYGWDPKTIMAGSNRKLSWRCPTGHIFVATVIARTNLKSATNCPYCTNQKILNGFNDIATLFPEIATQADGWNPNLIGAGHKKKLPWKCTEQHPYEASPESRTQKFSGCPVCAGLKVIVGINDLLTTHPQIASEAIDWDPTKVIAGTPRKYKWLCPDGHQYLASVNKRTERGQGCAICQKYGFNPGKDAFIYFLNQPIWEMFQIGITNNIDERLSRHKNLDWEVLELRGPMDGHLARQWETAILRMLKAKGADLSNEKIAGKFDGYSEAWTKATFPVESIKELMRLTDEFEENLGKGRRVE